MERLTTLEPGQAIPYGGDKVARVPTELADAFTDGDRLVVVGDTGDLLHVPAQDAAVAERAVGAALEAFQRMGTVTDEQVSAFYEAFATRLEDDATFAPIAAANDADVERARDRGRSTTRLVLSGSMRRDMIEVVRTVAHEGWQVQLVRAGLGVVGFVFEGRPNVFADACGVLRSGNTVVFRIGSDALGTARAIVEHALDPAIDEAGLPPGAASLVDSAAHAAGWAMFDDDRLGLAVARGSGHAVAQLGAVARQAGIPVSLHGTGGAWIVAGDDAVASDFRAAVRWSLDRKVCNTLNTCCIPAARAHDLVPVFLDALTEAADARGTNPKLHVSEDSLRHVPAEWFDTEVAIARAEGDVTEPKAQPIASDRLGVEWEWEDSPEVTLVVVDDVADAAARFNAQSPRLAASLVSPDPLAQQRFFEAVDAPFVGNGFTRWVDGQYALGTPELGLSNWQHGRLFARGGVLSGDSVFTLRTRATQTDPDLHR